MRSTKAGVSIVVFVREIPSSPIGLQPQPLGVAQKAVIMTITDFLTSTFPAWSPSPELLRAPADSCDKLLEHMSNDMSYTEALQALRSNDTTDWDDDGASGVDVLVVGFLFTLALIAAVDAYLVGA